MPAPTIRPATPDDAPAIAALVGSLADHVLADPADRRAAVPFFATVTPGAVHAYLTGGRFQYHVAEAGGAVVGAVGVRDGTHLYHLFVAEAYHGQGLARRLWTAALEAAGAPARMTVNASRVAAPVYARFGFVAAGPEVVQHGVAFVPMVREAGR